MQQHLKDQLAELRLCLAALPADIPIPKESKYKFSNFSPDAEWAVDIGEAAAVNRELEVRLGSRVDGLKLVERGPEMEAIVHVFETWTKKFPGDVILEKWVDDTLEAARGLILAAGKAANSSSTKQKPIKVNHTQIPGKRKHKVQKLDSHILSTFDDDRYISAGEDEDSRKGGAKMHPLLRKVFASRGCNITWSWPRARQQIMKHAANECPSMAREWRKEARDYMASKAVQGKGKGVVLEAGSKSNLDSNDVMLLDVEDRLMKKPRMELQVVSSSKQVASFNKKYVTEGHKALKEKGDQALMLFVTCTGIPPHVIDSDEFKAFCSILNANYKSTSATTLADTLIPNKSARITKMMFDYLKTQRDLTVTFDGGKIPRRFYTVHVTTADRRTLLLELDDASMLSHTAQYIGELLEGILAFMDKSGYAMEHFNYHRGVLKIGWGLEKISKTRFANIHWSAASLQRCLPAMQAIVSNPSLGIDVKVRHYANTTDSLMFQVALAKLVAITGPYTKAIQCLESAHTTCADVYLYWLAIVAQMEQLLRGNTIRLREETKLAIRTITNARFNQMINDAPNDPYITAFFLHPEHRTAQIYKNINPLDLPPIHMTKANGTYSIVSPEDSIMKRVGTSLQLMLKHEYGDVYDVVRSDQAAAKLMKERNPRFTGLTPREALQALKVELKEYHKGADPFNCKIRKHENVRDWWLAVQKDENAQVLGALAIKLYSVVPVSMADERTV
ncbi:uncharacterized protein EDB93DRAFT_1076704, partial [Suillus bovinus]|uniref:uncharacterized protein n=1 Tax=Suillus bovinus TaxID=48563 RepID=UPI001B884F5D